LLQKPHPLVWTSALIPLPPFAIQFRSPPPPPVDDLHPQKIVFPVTDLRKCASFLCFFSSGLFSSECALVIGSSLVKIFLRLSTSPCPRLEITQPAMRIEIVFGVARSPPLCPHVALCWSFLLLALLVFSARISAGGPPCSFPHSLSFLFILLTHVFSVFCYPHLQACLSGNNLSPSRSPSYHRDFRQSSLARYYLFAHLVGHC